MSQIIASRVINFLIQLSPTVNPYQEAADYIATFLQPCPLPSWSRHLQHFSAAGSLILICQSFYVLHLRSKEKQIYQIGFNSLGLIQLDRANHCVLCYFLYGITAFVDCACEEAASAGRLDQAWPNLLLGLKCTLTIMCSVVILWLCICHFALLRRRDNGSSISPVRRLLPKAMMWTLNGFLLIMILLPIITILIAFIGVTVEYFRIKWAVTPMMRVLHKSASQFSPGMNYQAKLLKTVFTVVPSLNHIDLIWRYTQVGLTFYLVFSGSVFLMYIPFIIQLSRSYLDRRGVRDSMRILKQEERVLVNTILEFTLTSFLASLTVYLCHLARSGDFMFDPRFWITMRVMNAIISVLGNVAVYLILYSLRKPYIFKSEVKANSSTDKMSL